MSTADAQPITILHLSDLQFGPKFRFGSPKELRDRLVDDLREQGLRPSLVVASGDIAETGKRSEYERFLELATGLCDELELDRKRFAIVPGNHDINRDACRAYFDACAADETEPSEPYWPKWKHFVEMLARFYGEESADSFVSDRPWTLFEVPELKVALAGLNSTMKESHRDGDHYGFVGEAQLRWFANELRRLRDAGWIRIGVVHHNFQRAATSDDENLRDAPELERAIGDEIHFLLHGHRHEAGLGRMANAVPVLSTGSTAVGVGQRAEEVPNQYQFLTLRAKAIERWTRQYDPRDKRWIADPRASKKGDRGDSEVKLDWIDAQAVFPSGGSSRSLRDEWEQARRELTERYRGESFADRIIEVVQLRHPDARVSLQRIGDPPIEYLRVACTEGTVHALFPVGLFERGLDGAGLDSFARLVLPHYRIDRPGPVGDLVYGGPERAPEELRREAYERGVRVHSVSEYQGILDLRTFRQRQGRRLESDPIYPWKLYIEQRLLHGTGSE